ncbi:MAG: endonuclease/exonuclease/phosphatase family protein [Treponema sp.]|nr:endonuclease/exonuclease/phosphatase family protein [Treponema sp.]
MKIMSFNVCSLRTWGGFDSAEWLEWKKSLKEIVECNNVDVVMLQEVYKYDPSFINDLSSFLGGDVSVISTEAYSDCNRNLHNAVFYRSSNFGNRVEDITKDFWNYQNRNNNFQVIKFGSGSKELILVNVHLASDGNARIVEGSEHAEDLRNLEQLLTCLENQFPDAYIMAGGDFNFSNDLLSKHFSDNQVLTNWLLDDENTTGKGTQTTVTQTGQMGNAMDHFIYSPNLKTRISKQAFNDNKDDPWNFTLGVLHIQKHGETVIRIGNLKEVSFNEYHTYISDHFPIITEINL